MCGKRVDPRNRYSMCMDCLKSNDQIMKSGKNVHAQKRKVENRPSRKRLEFEIENFTFSELGRMYGVCDTTIKKWCKFYGMDGYNRRDINNKKSPNIKYLIYKKNEDLTSEYIGEINISMKVDDKYIIDLMHKDFMFNLDAVSIEKSDGKNIVYIN